MRIGIVGRKWKEGIGNDITADDQKRLQDGLGRDGPERVGLPHGIGDDRLGEGRVLMPLFDTKNGEDRTIPLSTRAIAVLKALPRNMDGKVFTADISHSFTAACARAGIEDLRFHVLRHEATNRLFEKGFDPMEGRGDHWPQDIADAETLYSSKS